MALLMLLFMGKMYPNKKLNVLVIVTAIVVFTGAFAGLRTQTPISDVQYMQAMIPHHSSALLTSKHADIKDPQVKALSKQIIKAQKEEIAQMEAMIKRLEE